MANRVTGLRATKDNLHRLGLVFEAEAEPVIQMLGQLVAEDMSAHVHKTRGGDVHLADDIKVGNVERHGHSMSVKIGPSRRTGWRARFVEFGTKFASARPFIRPARDKARQIIRPKMRDKLAGVVKL